MKTELESRISEANRLLDAGKFGLAKKMFSKLAEEDPQSTRILAGLGLTCLEMGDLEEAVVVFKRAIGLAPTLEGVSKGLFHSLWKLERRVQALEEIKRFQSVSDSEDYRAIIKEINETF